MTLATVACAAGETEPRTILLDDGPGSVFRASVHDHVFKAGIILQ